MNYDEPENFIRVYDNVVSKEFCRGIIDYFEWCSENNKTWERGETTSIYKKDESCCIQPSNFWEINFAKEHLSGYIEDFNRAFWDDCYPKYVKDFDIINTFSRHNILTYKVQKTVPSGGYHVWHCEHGIIEFSRRISTFVLYLNDVPSGGETEFLHQRVRVAPKEGTLVIFPASYTHVHRGNPPLRGTKYILTGWIEFA